MSQNSDDFVEFQELAEVDDVVDEAATDDSVVPARYDITSFGADYDVEGLVRRLDRGDVFIPDFQRDYVWKMNEASRFIESLLLGLPVPGVFLATESETNKLLVIDGQQRLKTLQFFYKGVFDPRPEDKKQRVFALTKVQRNFDGLTYEQLDERDRIKLDNSIIHATVVKQEAPADDDTSIYHIFERLNNGGRRLTPQEIRTALYHGPFVDSVKELNEYPAWREIYGRKNNRLKDRELILRFLALYFDHVGYAPPMTEFLNKFISRHKNGSAEFIDSAESIFKRTVELALEALGTAAFRPERSLNAAVFDSVMVGMATRIAQGSPINDISTVADAYAHLFKDEQYVASITSSTSNEKSVSTRILKAVEVFAGV
jgi:hypothetical protein